MDDVRACRSKAKAKAVKMSATEAQVDEAGRKEMSKTGDSAPTDEFLDFNAMSERDNPRNGGSVEANFSYGDPFSHNTRCDPRHQEDVSNLEVPATVGDSREVPSDYLATGPFAPGGSKALFPFPFLDVPLIPSTHELATLLAMQNAERQSFSRGWPLEAGACLNCYEATMSGQATDRPVMPDPVQFTI